MLKFKGYLSEAYSFFPKSADDIRNGTEFSQAQVDDIISLFSFLKTKQPSVETPINIDLKKPKMINVSRDFDGILSIKEIEKGAELSAIKIKFGNGSSGNRGANNRGNLFEGQFANALELWWAGEEVEDKDMLSAIQDLDKTYGLRGSKKFQVKVEGGENTKRPLTFGSKIILDNPKGSGYDVGQSLTDITIETDKGPIFLSLKLGGTTTFFNVGVRKILTPKEIKDRNIKNPNGLRLLSMFGIDPVKFAQVFNGEMPKGEVDRRASYDKRAIGELLKSGIGYNYHVIHKLGKKIISKKMDSRAMEAAAKIRGNVVVYYGGKTGRGKRVDVEFESGSYVFKINIRDTQGKDGYPTRMMCDFTTKK